MLAVSQADATKLAFIEGLGKANDNSVVMWVAVRPPDGQAVEMDVTLENIDSMLGGGGIRPNELKEKYGNFITARIQAEIAADTARNAAASGTVAPTDSTGDDTAANEADPMSESSPIKIFITGACAGLAEVRQALAVPPRHRDRRHRGRAREGPGEAGRHRRAGRPPRLRRAATACRPPTSTPSARPPPRRSCSSRAATPPACCTRRSAAGVADVVLLPQLTDALVFTIRRRTQLVHQRGGSARWRSLRPSTASGKIITIFSPKGGVGKTVLACGLAHPARPASCERRALLLDLDLQFGDAAIMMGIEPEKTIYDLVMTTGELDTEKLAGYVTHHPSGVDLVPAPVRPEDAELVAEDRVARLLDVAKESYDAIVVDTPAFFQATTLATARPHRAPAARVLAGHPHGQERQAHAADAQPAALPQGPHPPRAQPRRAARAS